MELPQQQNIDLGGAVMKGYEFGQNARMNNLKMLAAQNEIDQKRQMNSLYSLASTGDQNATRQLAAIAPDAYKGLQQQKFDEAQFRGNLAYTVSKTPLPLKNKLIASIKKEHPDLPISDQWYEGMYEAELAPLINQARKVDDMAKEEFERPLQQARIQTEAFQQRNYAANTAKSYADIAHTNAETNKTKLETSPVSPQAEKQKGMDQVSYIGARMNELYNKLDETGGIINPEKGSFENLVARFRSGNSGQVVGKALGTKEQSYRREIDNLRNQAKTAIMQASGLSSKAFDSNVEAKALLDSLGSPDQDIDSSLNAVKAFVDRYGNKQYKYVSPDTEKSGNIITKEPQLAPKIGMIEDGNRFKGGNPADPNNWSKFEMIEDGHRFKGGNPADPNNWSKL